MRKQYPVREKNYTIRKTGPKYIKREMKDDNSKREKITKDTILDMNIKYAMRDINTKYTK